nr:hypothetical protein [Candidatus Omnitrophota bacterium]
MKRVLVVLVAALAFCPFWTAANAEDVAVNGHKIAVDKAIRDWKGAVPEAENTAAVSEGEYIWKD